MPGDATMATSALLRIRRQNYGTPLAWFAHSCATSSARVSAAGVQLVPSPTAKRELRPSSVEVQCSGDRKTGSLGITGRQNEAEDSQMMELLMKMHELQDLQMQLALQSSNGPSGVNEVQSEMVWSVGSFSVSPVLGGNEAFSPSGRSESFWLWTFEPRMWGKPDNN